MYKSLKLLIASLLGLSSCATDQPPEVAQAQPPVPDSQSEVPTSSWDLIAQAKLEADGSQDAFEKCLKGLLIQQSADGIQSFDSWFRGLHSDANQWSLWGAAYIINGGCGDDGFHYFRNWLIAQGEAAFNAGLSDPDSLADYDLVLDPSIGAADFEGLAYVAADAYQEKTGKEIPYPQASGLSPIQGEEWDEDDLPNLFPKLALKYEW